jgi:hypothetical protein
MNNMKKQFVRICPECNSTYVTYDLSNPALVNAGMTNNAFVCKNCGNKGSFFPEIQKNKVPKVKKPKKRNLVNTQYYNNNINWLWEIIGPLSLVIGISLCFLGIPFIIFFLVNILPFGLIATLNGYSEKLRENKIFKIIFIIVLFYSIIIGPFISQYFWNSFYNLFS